MMFMRTFCRTLNNASPTRHFRYSAFPRKADCLANRNKSICMLVAFRSIHGSTIPSTRDAKSSLTSKSFHRHFHSCTDSPVSLPCPSKGVTRRERHYATKANEKKNVTVVDASKYRDDVVKATKELSAFHEIESMAEAMKQIDLQPGDSEWVKLSRQSIAYRLCYASTAISLTTDTEYIGEHLHTSLQKLNGNITDLEDMMEKRREECEIVSPQSKQRNILQLGGWWRDSVVGCNDEDLLHPHPTIERVLFDYTILLKAFIQAIITPSGHTDIIEKKLDDLLTGWRSLALSNSPPTKEEIEFDFSQILNFDLSRIGRSDLNKKAAEVSVSFFYAIYGSCSLEAFQASRDFFQKHPLATEEYSALKRRSLSEIEILAQLVEKGDEKEGSLMKAVCTLAEIGLKYLTLALALRDSGDDSQYSAKAFSYIRQALHQRVDFVSASELDCLIMIAQRYITIMQWCFMRPLDFTAATHDAQTKNFTQFEEAKEILKRLKTVEMKSAPFLDEEPCLMRQVLHSLWLEVNHCSALTRIYMYVTCHPQVTGHERGVVEKIFEEMLLRNIPRQEIDTFDVRAHITTAVLNLLMAMRENGHKFSEFSPLLGMICRHTNETIQNSLRWPEVCSELQEMQNSEYFTVLPQQEATLQSEQFHKLLVALREFRTMFSTDLEVQASAKSPSEDVFEFQKLLFSICDIMRFIDVKNIFPTFLLLTLKQLHEHGPDPLFRSLCHRMTNLHAVLSKRGELNAVNYTQPLYLALITHSSVNDRVELALRELMQRSANEGEGQVGNPDVAGELTSGAITQSRTEVEKASRELESLKSLVSSSLTHQDSNSKRVRTKKKIDYEEDSEEVSSSTIEEKLVQYLEMADSVLDSSRIYLSDMESVLQKTKK